MSRNYIESLVDKSSPLLTNLNRDPIGRGAYGVVNKVQVTRNFAVKDIFLRGSSTELESELKCAFSEYELMSKNLKNVVRSYEFLYDPKRKMFSYTMDLMDKSLDSHINDLKNPLSFDKAFPLLHNITTGKRY
jgi:serine/threonine protein kinase